MIIKRRLRLKKVNLLKLAFLYYDVFGFSFSGYIWWNHHGWSICCEIHWNNGATGKEVGRKINERYASICTQ